MPWSCWQLFKTPMLDKKKNFQLNELHCKSLTRCILLIQNRTRLPQKKCLWASPLIYSKIVDYAWSRRLGMCHVTKTLTRCHRRAPLRRSVFPRFLVVAKMVRIIRTEIFFFPLYIANLHAVLPAFG